MVPVLVEGEVVDLEWVNAGLGVLAQLVDAVSEDEVDVSLLLLLKNVNDLQFAIDGVGHQQRVLLVELGVDRLDSVRIQALVDCRQAADAQDLVAQREIVHVDAPD